MPYEDTSSAVALWISRGPAGRPRTGTAAAGHTSSRVPCHMLYQRVAGNARAGLMMFEPGRRFSGPYSTIIPPSVGAAGVNQPVTRCAHADLVPIRTRPEGRVRRH